MITLILEDFRAFSKKEFTFEECKSTLISGTSGAGKTTIFMAINFAAYGTGRDLVKRGKKKCRVVMKTDQILITRSKGPERLIVEKDQRMYEKDEAQAVIDATYPHLHLGYVSQLAHKSLLMLTPADKLKFIENMAFDKMFVETINRNVKGLINERRLELEKTRKERETMETMLQSLEVEKIEHPPDNEFTTDDVLCLITMKEDYVHKADAAMHELNLKKKLEQDIRAMEECDATIAQLEDRVKTLTEEEYRWNQYSSALSALEKMKKPMYSVEEIDQMMACWNRIEQIDRELVKSARLESQLKSLQCIKPLKTVNIDDKCIGEYLIKAKDYENLRQIEILLDALPRYRWTCAELEEMAVKRKFAKEYVDNKERLDHLIAKKADCTLMKTCPNCKSLLGLWNGQLFAADECKTEKNAVVLTLDEAAEMDREILALSIKCNGFEGILEHVDSYKTVNISLEMQKQREVENQRNFLLKKKVSIGEIDGDYDPEVVRAVKTYAHDIELYNKNMEDYRVLSARLEEYRDVRKERDAMQEPPVSYKELQKMKKCAQDYSYLAKKCTELECDRPVEQSEKYRKMLLIANEKQSKLLQLASINVSDDSYDRLRLQLDEIDNRLFIAQKHVKNAEAYSHWKKVRDVGIAEKQLEESYPRAVLLQSVIHEAEKESLEETLEQLNSYTQLYLDKFVENLTLEFIFDSKISVNMIHNGHKTDVNSLSGGEYSRVMLAVTLALAEMHGVDLLMLDESISSLDQQTTCTVLDAIKENFNGTILCIAHQTVMGTFDRVVRL